MDKIQSLIVNFNKNLISPKTLKTKIKEEENLNIPIKLFEGKNLTGKKIFELRKEYRQKNMLITSKMGNDLRRSRNGLDKKLDNYERKSKMNSEIIKKGLNSQETSISQKLNLRRDKSRERSLIKIKNNLDLKKNMKKINDEKIDKNKVNINQKILSNPFLEKKILEKKNFEFEDDVLKDFLN